MHVKETQRSRATNTQRKKELQRRLNTVLNHTDYDWLLTWYLPLYENNGEKMSEIPCYHICINRLGYISIIWVRDGNERCASGTKRTCNLRVGNKVKAIPIYVALTVTSYRSFCQLFVFNERPLRFLELYGSLSRAAYLLFTFTGVPLLPYLGVMPNKTQSKKRITFFGNPE